MAKSTSLAIFLLFQTFSPAAWKSSPLKAMIDSLQKGISWDYTRTFLILEARYFQATTVGLPVEISKYYNAITAVNFNGEKEKTTTM